MRKSRQGGLQPSLTQKVESKLLISSKQTSTLSTHLINKLDHYRHEEHLQREYNLKFMTDRKRNSHQKSQKSLSTSKVTHKESRPKPNPTINIQPQRLDFDSIDYRTKYYQLHEEYIGERRKNMEKSQQALALREALGNFLSCFDSKSADEICGLLEGEKLREGVRRAVENRRRWESMEGVLREAMRILQVDSWEQLIHNLRARVQRFRSLDECTFKILELQAINKRVVNDFEERLQRIRDDQEEEWARQKQILQEEQIALQSLKQNSERENEALRTQLQITLSDLAQLASEQNAPRLVSGRNEVHQLQRLLVSLRSRLQEIEVEAEQNMFKLLKSNEEMLKLQRSIEQLRGEMEQQIEDLQQKNEQNLCEVSHLQAQLEQQEQEIEHYRQDAKQKQAERTRAARQEEDQRVLMAAALNVTDTHPAKLLLAIKERQEKYDILNKECTRLQASMQDKDKLSLELQAQIAKLTRSAQQAQETVKGALYQKEEYKFLLNNLRDQFSEIKRQHQEELARTIQRKDEEIVNSNHDILESHATLTDELSKLRGDHTKLTIQHEENRANLMHFRSKCEQAERLLIEKEGVIKRLIAEGERYKRELREIEGSFKQVVDLEEVTSKRALALQTEKVQNTRLIASFTHRNAELIKTNDQLAHEKNGLKTELSTAQNDIKELKDIRAKLEAINVELRLEGLNKQSQITKLEEKLKVSDNQVKVLKAGNDKLMGEVNSVTRKLISARNQCKKKIAGQLKQLLPALREIKAQNNALKALVREKLSLEMASTSEVFITCLREIYHSHSNKISEKHVQTVNAECQWSIESAEKETQCSTSTMQCESQCLIISSDLRDRVFQSLTTILTSLSLLRSQKHEIEEALLCLQTFNIEQIFKMAVEDDNARLRHLQGSIEMIREDSLEEQESEIRDMAKIITPDEIFPLRNDGEDVNLVLQALLDEDEVPSLPYWEKIETNFLALRRRLLRRNHLKLDISAIDCRDPSLGSPLSSAHEGEIMRRMTTDPDELFETHKESNTNRSERFNMLELTRRENEQLKMRLEQVVERLGESQDELQELKGKLVKLENETSIVGLQHNFKKVLDYLLNDNADLFLQTCRILMKMLHFAEAEIKDFQEQLQTKRKKKKGGLFAGLFKA